MQLIPTILCGGSGSRLWPVSRELHPKPFIRLADGQSLLQKAWLRAAALPDVNEILTVTNRELLFKTKDEYAEVGRTAREGTATVVMIEVQLGEHLGEDDIVRFDDQYGRSPT